MRNKLNKLGLSLALAGTAAIFAACDSGNSGAGCGIPSGEAYLAGTRVWDDVQTTSYFHLTASLGQDGGIDPECALEVPGAAKLFAVEELGWFAVGGSEQPTITHYTLDEEGMLTEGESVSLLGFGVTSLWNTLYFVSDTRAYYPDRDNSQLIAWNPSTMEVEGVIPLPATERDGYLSLYGYTPVMRGDKLLFPVGWFDWTNDYVLDETGLVVIDTTDDSVERVDTDERCGGITETVVTSNGDAYFVSSALAGSAYRLERLDTEPCALRILNGEDEFDDGYLKNLDTLVDADILGEPIPAGGSSIFLRVLDEELATINEETDFSWNITGQAAWRWIEWNVSNDNVTEIDTLDPSTADVIWFLVDGKVYGSQTAPDYSETTLIDLTADGGPLEALTVPGFLHGLARVQ